MKALAREWNWEVNIQKDSCVQIEALTRQNGSILELRIVEAVI